MLITIDLNDCYIPVLSKWASVSRTLKTAEEVCREAEFPDPTGDILDKQAIACSELPMITAMLDALHQAARSEVWKQRP